jgi:hypothetical protein
MGCVTHRPEARKASVLIWCQKPCSPVSSPPLKPLLANLSRVAMTGLATLDGSEWPEDVLEHSRDDSSPSRVQATIRRTIEETSAESCH